jgi:hypothetical protein
LTIDTIDFLYKDFKFYLANYYNYYIYKMPQTNITYDTPYNRHLVAFEKGKLAKHFAVAGNAYAPTDMGFKLSNFHNDYSQEPKISEMVGGGSPSPQKYMLNGNSPAYPPISMSSGLAVSSGGARYSGIDGAVGGSFLSDVGSTFNHIAREVGPDLAREVIKSQFKGSGRRKGKKVGGDVGSDILSGLTTAGKTILKFAPFLGLGRKGGSAVGDQIASVFKTVAPFAPLLLGLGHPEPKTKADVARALAHLGAKATHSLPKMAELALRGGYDISDFGNDVANVVKGIIGLGHPKKRKAKGGLSLSDVLESAKPAITKAKEIAEANPEIVNALKNKVGSVAKKALGLGKKKGGVTSGGAGGRAKRAEIVKKIMKDRGVSMISASKIVKSEGLY